MGGRTLNAQGRSTLIAAILGSALVFLDSTVVNVALPRIGRDLPTIFLGVFEGQSYVYTGYLLTLSAFLVLSGAANDDFGRRRMFQLGTLGFGVMSLLCGIAPNMEALALFRILQGLAGALLVPSSLSLITASFEGEERALAFGYWSGATAAALTLGPLIGGILVDSLTWRAAFLLNVPFAVAALAATRQVPESRDLEGAGRFDVVGSLLAVLAVGGLAFGAIYGQQHEWRDPIAFVALAVGVVGVVALPVWMTRAAHPLVPPELFRSRNFTIVNVSTFLIYGALYVNLYYLTLFLQGVLGYSAAAAGLATLPPGLVLALFSSRVGSVAGRSGTRPFMVAGPLVMAAGILGLVLVPADAAPWRLGQGDALPPPDYVTRVLPALVVYGAGLALLVTPLVTALMGSVPVRHSGLASAVNNAVSRVGPQLVGAVLFIAVSASFYGGLERRVGDLEQRMPGYGDPPPSLRDITSPLNPVRPTLPNATYPQAYAQHLMEIDRASREASTDAFHLAMSVAAVALVAGALVNLGVRDAR